MSTKFFIDKPVFSGVISLTIVALGLLALFNLPIERYPDIAPPSVNVTATYPGAKAETVQKSIIAPLEEAINGIENVRYITSTANNDGNASISVYFRPGTNSDIATINVQNRVTTVLSILPAEASKAGVFTSKQINSELMTMMLYSPDNTYSEEYIDNYMSSIVVPRIERMSGVSRVTKFGSEYALRIWLKPDAMAAYGLVPSDISALIDSQNLEASTGSFGENHENPYQYSVKYRGRLSTPEEFGNIVIATGESGTILRLRDVADVEMGRLNYSILENVSGKNGSGIAIMQSENSNANATIKKLEAEFRDMEKDLPQGLSFEVLNNSNQFLHASIRNVLSAFFLSIFLVLLIVFLFLKNLRATIIPALSIVIAIIGTFGFMYLAGFSINLLTLFALVLCIGTVVDDSIVVVEAVQEKYVEGYKSHYKATCDAMSDVSVAVVVTTLIFMSVFIPVAMIGGTAGTFYKQFGLTMAVAVCISTLAALTIVPVLSILLIHPYDKGQVFSTALDAITLKYLNGVKYFIRHKGLAVAILATCIFALVFMVKNTKTGLIPQEDTSIVFVCTSAEPGKSLLENQKVLRRLDSVIRSFPEVALCVEEGGYSFIGSGPNMGQFFIRLNDWGQRRGSGMSADDVVARIYSKAAEFPELNILAMQNSMIPGYGSGSNFELFLQDKNNDDIGKFKEVSDRYLTALSQRPEISAAYASFSSDYPQYTADVDAARCKSYGVEVSEVLSVLGTYLGGSYVSNFNRFSRVYRVMVQASPDARVSPDALDHMYVRTQGGMAPLSEFIRLERTYGPEYLTRFNLFSSIPVSGSPAPGYSTGDAIRAVKETAEEYLPQGYGYEFGGLSREEESSGNNLVLIIIVSIALIYLILCSLYESFLLPFVIILAVPCGLFGSFLFARFFGLENNIYLQTAVIMLIGLLAKTAILVTDYAGRFREQGASLAQAAMSAARARLRPILMTSLTMIIGLLPLLFARGACAKSNITIGASIVGGMTVGTLAMLFIVPTLWVCMQYLQEKAGASFMKRLHNKRVSLK